MRFKDYISEGIEQDIKKTKASLIKKWKRKGPHENFGQGEIRKLQDKYHYNSLIYGTPKERAQAKKIDALDDWAMNYTGE